MDALDIFGVVLAVWTIWLCLKLMKQIVRRRRYGLSREYRIDPQLIIKPASHELKFCLLFEDIHTLTYPDGHTEMVTTTTDFKRAWYKLVEATARIKR